MGGITRTPPPPDFNQAFVFGQFYGCRFSGFIGILEPENLLWLFLAVRRQFSKANHKQKEKIIHTALNTFQPD
jgi:hypothetical protein